MATDKQPTVIKKYANRRLYNTSTSSYVTLDDLAEMVKKGTDFSVYDAKTGEDITRSVLTQIIFDEENKGQNLLPIRFLRQLIRFYGDSMQAFIPSYLEFSLESLTREQERFRQQMMESFGGEPFRAMEEQARLARAALEHDDAEPVNDQSMAGADRRWRRAADGPVLTPAGSRDSASSRPTRSGAGGARS